MNDLLPRRPVWVSLLWFAVSLLPIGAGGLRALRAEDLVDRKGAATVRGDVTQISRTEVVVKARNIKREYRIPANEIERVRWDGEKPQLSQVRVEERNGQFDKAIAGYENALKDAAGENLKTDLEFSIARAAARKALAEEGKSDDAIARLEKFQTAHSTSFRYFECLKLLARLYLAKPDLDKANATLKQMAEAPWTDYKMDADILQARAAVARNDIDTALKALDNVIALKPRSAAEVSRRYEALLTKGTCLQKQGKFPQAVDVLTMVFDEAAEEDTKTLAEACVRLGDCYQAAGRTKEAILAYLRVDILFPKEKSHHAEALYYLARLFAQDGKPDKAASAAARLQEAHPRSPWTAKLSALSK